MEVTKLLFDKSFPFSRFSHFKSLFLNALLFILARALNLFAARKLTNGLHNGNENDILQKMPFILIWHLKRILPNGSLNY